MALLIRFESVQQIVDDALDSATTAGNGTSNDADAKFKRAIDALSAYGKKYHLTESVTHMMAKAEVKDKYDRSSQAVSNRLMGTFRVREEYLDICFTT